MYKNVQYLGSVNYIKLYLVFMIDINQISWFVWLYDCGIYDVCNQAGLGCIVSCALLVISIGIFSAVYSSVVGFGNYHHDPMHLFVYFLPFWGVFLLGLGLD